MQVTHLNTLYKNKNTNYAAQPCLNKIWVNVLIPYAIKS
jgi:hypothetical protein